MSITANFPDVIYGHLNMGHFMLYDNCEVELLAEEDNNNDQEPEKCHYFLLCFFNQFISIMLNE